MVRHFIILILTFFSLSAISQRPTFPLANLEKSDTFGTVIISDSTKTAKWTNQIKWLETDRLFEINGGIKIPEFTAPLLTNYSGGLLYVNNDSLYFRDSNNVDYNLQTIITDLTLLGDGSVTSPLKVDTGVIATVSALRDSLSGIISSVITDETLNGDGSVGSPLSVDTLTYIATKADLTLKQDVLTNPITGTGTTNYLPKFGSSSTIQSSLNIREDVDTMFVDSFLNVDNNTLYVDASTNRVGIGLSSPFAKLDVLQINSNATKSSGSSYGMFVENDVTNDDEASYQGYAYGTVLRYKGTAGTNHSRGVVGYNSSAFNSSTGTVNNMAGFYLDLRNLSTGTITNAYGTRVIDFANSGGGTITNKYGAYTDISTSGATNAWNIYASGNAPNYFNGDVGIGTSSPSYTLDVNSTSALATIAYFNSNAGAGLIRVNSNGSGGGVDVLQDGIFRGRLGVSGGLIGDNSTDVGFASEEGFGILVGGGGGFKFKIKSNSDLWLHPSTAGSSSNLNNMSWSSTDSTIYFVSSSIRFKNNITDYDKGIEDLMKLKPVYYTYKDNNQIQAGFIAEDVDNSGFSEYTTYDANGLVYGLRVNAFKPLLVKAIQEQQAIIEQQSNKITTLESTIQQQSTKIQTLEETIQQLINRIEILENN